MHPRAYAIVTLFCNPAFKRISGQGSIHSALDLAFLIASPKMRGKLFCAFWPSLPLLSAPLPLAGRAFFTPVVWKRQRNISKF